MLCIVDLLDSNEVLGLEVKLNNSLIPLILSHHPSGSLQSSSIFKVLSGCMEEASVSNAILMVVNVNKLLQAYLN